MSRKAKKLPILGRVRLRAHPPELVKLQYPDLARRAHDVVARIDEPHAYSGVVLGVRYGSIIAWVYERDTVTE